MGTKTTAGGRTLTVTQVRSTIGFNRLIRASSISRATGLVSDSIS